MSELDDHYECNIKLWLDGYEDQEEHDKACAEFIYDQLNMTASCVKISTEPSIPVSELREWCEERLAEWQEQLTDYYSEVSEGIAVDEDTVNFLKDLIKEHQDLLARFCKEGK